MLVVINEFLFGFRWPAYCYPHASATKDNFGLKKTIPRPKRENPPLGACFCFSFFCCCLRAFLESTFLRSCTGVELCVAWACIVCKRKKKGMHVPIEFPPFSCL